MSEKGQTRKYSLGADVFRFAPGSGLAATTTVGPFRAKRRPADIERHEGYSQLTVNQLDTLGGH